MMQSAFRRTDDPFAHLELDREHFDAFLRITSFWDPWFRPVLEGREHLDGVVGGLLVANHGQFGFEMPCMLRTFDRETGRAVRGLGDRVLFQTPGIGRVSRALGAVEGHPDAAHALLTRGELCYVCPGGAREGLLGPEARYTLMWEGHVGFVVSAIRAQVPLVPLAVIGSDDLFVQVRTAEAVRASLPGRWVGRLVGAKYVPALYMGLGPMPLPQRLRFLVGEPMHLGVPASAADDPEVVARIHDAFRDRLQALIDRGLRERSERARETPSSVGALVERAALAMVGEPPRIAAQRSSTNVTRQRTPLRRSSAV